MFFIDTTANAIEYDEKEIRYATVQIPSDFSPVTLTLSLKVDDFEVKSEPFKLVSLDTRFSICIFNIRFYSSH